MTIADAALARAPFPSQSPECVNWGYHQIRSHKHHSASDGHGRHSEHWHTACVRRHGAEKDVKNQTGSKQAKNTAKNTVGDARRPFLGEVPPAPPDGTGDDPRSDFFRDFLDPLGDARGDPLGEPLGESPDFEPVRRSARGDPSTPGSKT